MWLTGFDAPSLHTLYLDKPMRGHGLDAGDRPRESRVGGQARRPHRRLPRVSVPSCGPPWRLYSARDREPGEPRCGRGCAPDPWTRLESALALLERDRVAAGSLAADPGGRLTVVEAVPRAPARARTSRPVHRDRDGTGDGIRPVRGRRARGREDGMRSRWWLPCGRTSIKYTAGVRTRDGTLSSRTFASCLSRAVMADGILDVFGAAGLDRPDIAGALRRVPCGSRQDEGEELGR